MCDIFMLLYSLSNLQMKLNLSYWILLLHKINYLVPFPASVYIFFFPQKKYDSEAWWRLEADVSLYNVLSKAGPRAANLPGVHLIKVIETVDCLASVFTLCIKLYTYLLWAGVTGPEKGQHLCVWQANFLLPRNKPYINAPAALIKKNNWIESYSH